MRPLFFLLLFLTPLFATTGFDYPNPTTLRLFNDGSIKPFCINVTSGIALENCGYDWADTMWGVSTKTGAGAWVFQYSEGLPMNYRVASDNATYANVTFGVGLAGGHSVVVNYNLTQYAAFIDIQPNFTTGASVPSNTQARFHIIQRNIKINDTVANNLAYFNNKTYNLSMGGKNGTANTTKEQTLALYRAEDGQQIFFGWNAPYKTRFDAWPQTNWSNRQTNLTFEFGTIAARKSYVVPIKWQDAELGCEVGTSVLSTSSSINATRANFTSTDRVEITATITKMGFGQCVYYIYYKTTSAAKFALIPSTITGVNINLPVGYTIGNTSTVATTQSSTMWTIGLGGQNTSWSSGNAFKNFTYQINVSGVTDSSGEAFAQGYKTIAVWDTKPPNATINTTNFTNYTLGNIYVNVWGIDETNLRVLELYSNETGTWKYIDKQNATNTNINKTIVFNFTRTGLSAGCYLYGARAMDTTLDAVSNKYNVTQNVTICVNSSGIIVPGGVIIATLPIPIKVEYPQEQDDQVRVPWLIILAFAVVLVSLFAWWQRGNDY